MVTSKIPASYWAGRWEASNIPVKFRGLLLKDYQHVHASGIHALKKAEEFVENFEEHYISTRRAGSGLFPDNRNNIGRGLLLVGRNGTRKSTLAASVLTEVQYLNPAGKVFYIRFSDWKKALTDTFEKEDTENKVKAKAILRKVEQAHLLCLDDIGQEHRTSSGFTESSLHELLRVRYEAALPTIATTNVSLSRIPEVYGESFDSFRHDAFDPLVIVGPDTRKTEK